MNNVIELTDENFETEVLNYKGVVLVDFWAEWCGPCQMMLPVISNFAEENPNVKTCKVNVEACPNIAIKNKIATIPTFLVFKDGKIVNESKMVGIQNKETLVAKTNI